MNVLDTLHKIGYENLNETPTHWQTRPLYRESNNNTALVIDKKTGLFYDFVQKVGGTLSQLVSLSTGLKTQKEIEDFLGSQITVAPEQSYELGEVKKFNKDLLLKLKKDHSYWINRGISEKTISTFEGGVAANGKMAGRYVFPIFNVKDEIVGFAGRSLIDNPSYPKWKLIARKSEWVYPILSDKYIKEKKQVILVESIGNCLSFYDVDIKSILVTFGTTVSNSIIKFLLRQDVNKINILFDNDSENNNAGNEAAIKAKNQLSRYFDKEQVNIITPPMKDINLMLIDSKQKFIDFILKNEI